jgi:hypothetical protein
MLWILFFFVLSVSAVPTPDAYPDFEPGEGLPSLSSLNITIAGLAAMTLPPRTAQTASTQHEPGCNNAKGALVRAISTFDPQTLTSAFRQNSNP